MPGGSNAISPSRKIEAPGRRSVRGLVDDPAAILLDHEIVLDRRDAPVELDLVVDVGEPRRRRGHLDDDHRLRHQRAASSIVDAHVTTTSGIRHSSPSMPTATPGPASKASHGRPAAAIAPLRTSLTFRCIRACRILVGAMSRTATPRPTRSAHRPPAPRSTRGTPRPSCGLAYVPQAWSCVNPPPVKIARTGGSSKKADFPVLACDRPIDVLDRHGFIGEHCVSLARPARGDGSGPRAAAATSGPAGRDGPADAVDGSGRATGS